MDRIVEGLHRLSETLAALSTVSRDDVLAGGRRWQQRTTPDSATSGEGREGKSSNTFDDSDSSSSTPRSCWTHYRKVPATIRQSYRVLEQGASLVHATSTKFALMSKIDASKSQEMADDLFRGCTLVGTACLALDPCLGPSARHHVLTASRGIITSVVQLLEGQMMERKGENKNKEVGGSGDGDGDDSKDGGACEDDSSSSPTLATRTGVVWHHCDIVLQRRLPVGNRNAMRRDLLTYLHECQETMDEFQAMIDEGPLSLPPLPTPTETTAASRNDAGELGGDLSGDDDGDEEEWEAFLDGRFDRYSSSEMSVAEACVSLVKCSRGVLNLVLQAEDAWGSDTNLREGDDVDNDDDHCDVHATTTTLSEEGVVRMERMGRIHELARSVGMGMTDLGAALYPPLAFDAVGVQVMRQSRAIRNALRSVVSMTIEGNDGDSDDCGTFNDDAGAMDLTGDLPPPVLELYRKLAVAIQRREAEALDAIAEAQLEERGGAQGGQE